MPNHTDGDTARPSDPADTPWRLAAFDVTIVVVAALAASVPIGAIWSLVRIGAVAWPYVREAQFVLGFVAILFWTVANRPGGRIRELETEDETFPVPAPDRRIALYRRVVGRGSPTIGDLPNRGVHVFAIGVALCLVSLGIELLVLWRMGT